MALRICVLASGSAANSIYVASAQTQILVDAGLSGREIARRLALIGADLDRLHAVCVTHEHDDHTAALGVLQRRHKTPLYANAATIEALGRAERLQGLSWQVFTTGAPFQVRDLTIEPFSVPHDAYDPVGFVVSDGAASVGIVTDIGRPTHLIRERLRRCQAVILESNHDERMLRDADRPWALKQRIASRQGHLSNDKAAEMLSVIANAGTQAVFLAHLSADCNRPETALHGARAALDGAGQSHVKVLLTYPDRVSEIVVVG
jgi:phosphoribosyl 1,2-cyclic phosphodiesterase